MDELKDLYNRVRVLKKDRNLRIGQCFFNATHDLYPEIAHEIAGTENDCFYEDNKIGDFLLEVMERLDKNKVM